MKKALKQQETPFDQSLAAARTKHPDLFRGTYWGGIDLLKSGDCVTPAIIQNRNRFAEEMRLRETLTVPEIYEPYGDTGRQLDFSRLDHVEVYTGATGDIVIVCSNYGDTAPLPELGMKETAPLYSTDCRSYAATFRNVRELQRACRRSVESSERQENRRARPAATAPNPLDN